MLSTSHPPFRVAIACGGTGGHLFPGLAVAGALRERGAESLLIVSEKEVDQLALGGESRFEVLRLPAVGLGGENRLRFLRRLWSSYRLCAAAFRGKAPDAVIGMGGFTSVAPALAGRRSGAALYLHDSNAIPGRANRWLSRWVKTAFVGFPEAATRLRCRDVVVSGTPVRGHLSRPASPSPARVELGLDPLRPVLLVMGGSQGARGVNQALLSALPRLAAEAPEIQYLHLTGASDLAGVEARYRELGLRAVTRPFLHEMELALGAATVAVSRAGASSIAEFAATRVPAILIPLPSAADDHQTANARAVAAAGGAVFLPQSEAQAGGLADQVLPLIRDSQRRQPIITALERLHRPDSAQQIADRICRHVPPVL